MIGQHQELSHLEPGKPFVVQALTHGLELAAGLGDHVLAKAAVAFGQLRALCIARHWRCLLQASSLDLEQHQVAARVHHDGIDLAKALIAVIERLPVHRMKDIKPVGKAFA